MFVRDFIRDHPIPYHYYAKLRLAKKLRLADSSTSLVIEGFPRVGNTFARYLFEECFSDAVLVSHVHSRAALKAALRKSVPVLILFREPQQAIGSWLVKTNPNRTLSSAALNLSIHDYSHFYSFALRSEARFKFIEFTDLIKDPSGFLRLCASVMQKELSDDLAVSAVSRAMARMQVKEADKDRMGSSLPNKERNDRKAEVSIALEKHSQTNELLGLYERMKTRKERFL